MKTFFMGAIVVLLLGAGYYVWTTQPKSGDNTPLNPYAEYFGDRIVALGVADIGQPIEGFDSNLLIAAFPGLVPADFEGVETVEGSYKIENGVVIFVRDQGSPITSAERMVSEQGYATLLAHVSARLGITVVSNASVDEVIAQINTSEHVEARIGESASALGVTILPQEVLEDSRCPVDVQCIWAGTVRLRALLTSGLGEAPQVFELGKPITTEVEEITLVEVLPGSEAGGELKASDYRFIFEISKRIM